MIKKISSIIKKMSFRNRLFLSFVIVAILPLLILGSLAYYNANKVQYAEKVNLLESNINQLTATINSKVSSINRISELLIFNTGLIEMLDDNIEASSPVDQYIWLRDIYTPSINYALGASSDIKNIVFYSTAINTDFRSDLRPLNSAETPSYILEYNQTSIPKWVNNKEQIIVINEIPSSLSPKQRTIVAIELDKSKFFDSLIIEGESYRIRILNEKYELIYPDEFEEPKKNELAAKEPLEEVLDNEIWYLHYFNLKNESTPQIQSIILSTLSLVLGVILLSFLVTRFFTSYILNVLDELKNKVKKVTKNDLSVEFKSNHQDEFGELSNLIGEMLESINELIDKNYNMTIEKQDSQYQALVSQINSHFLYNSLSLINWKAIMSDNLEISHIVQTLSKFYRTTLNNGRTPISLEEEIQNAKAYIELQLYLDPNQFKVVYDFQIPHNNIFVINLLLQPLIENAIEHGFSEKPTDAEIKIVTKKNDSGDLIIAVIDNGRGMSEEELGLLLTEEYKGYGLKNINKRLQFYFGKKYGLTVNSHLNRGTTIIMKIPYLEETAKIDNHEILIKNDKS